MNILRCVRLPVVLRGRPHVALRRSYSRVLKMRLTFAAANRVYYDDEVVHQVDVPTFSGSMGILADHVPTLAVLRPGIVRVIEKDGKAVEVFVSSGNVSVNQDSSVQVLAEEAHDLNDIDLDEAKNLLALYKSKYINATTPIEKIEASIAIECTESMISALAK